MTLSIESTTILEKIGSGELDIIEQSRGMGEVQDYLLHAYTTKSEGSIWHPDDNFEEIWQEVNDDITQDFKRVVTFSNLKSVYGGQD